MAYMIEFIQRQSATLVTRTRQTQASAAIKWQGQLTLSHDLAYLNMETCNYVSN